MKVKTGLFDIGGVFVQYDLRLITSRLCRDFDSLHEDEITRLLFQSELILQYETGEMDTDLFHQRVQEILGIHISMVRFQNVWQDIFKPIPSMIELIENLDGRIQRVAISNTNPMHIEFLRENYPFMGHFENSVYSYETGCMKPEEQIFKEALIRSGSDPAECFFVDDKLENICAAESLGIPSIYFKNPAEAIKMIHCHLAESTS